MVVEDCGREVGVGGFGGGGSFGFTDFLPFLFLRRLVYFDRGWEDPVIQTLTSHSKLG